MTCRIIWHTSPGVMQPAGAPGQSQARSATSRGVEATSRPASGAGAVAGGTSPAVAGPPSTTAGRGGAGGGGGGGRGGGAPPLRERTQPVPVAEKRETRLVPAARLAGKAAAETVTVLMAVLREAQQVER